jgi:hypothetical protein
MKKSCVITLDEIKKLAEKDYGMGFENAHFQCAVWMLLSNKLGILRHKDLDANGKPINSVIPQKK